MSADDWPTVIARVGELREVLAVDPDDAGAARVAVGRLVDAARRWHDIETGAITTALAAGPTERLDALCAEERLQRVEDVLQRVWSAATSPASIDELRHAIDALATM